MTARFSFFQASVAGLTGTSLDLNRLTAALPTRPTGADVLTGDSLFRIATPSLPDTTAPLSMASLFRKPQEVLFAEATEGAMVTAGSDSKIDQPAGFGLSPSSLRIHADQGYWEVDLPSELADELRAFLPGNDVKLFYTSPDSLHVTLVGPQDLARLVALEQEKDSALSKSKAQKIVKDKVKALTAPSGTPRITGIGSAVDPSGSHTVYFATVEWPEVQERRKDLGLKEKDLHATLASTASETDPQTGLPTGKPKDVHYADSNKTPISKGEPNVVRFEAEAKTETKPEREILGSVSSERTEKWRTILTQPEPVSAKQYYEERPDNLRALRALLRDESPDIRIRAAVVLTQYDKYDRDVLPDLQALLRDADPGVRARIPQLLAQLESRQVIDDLRTMLKDEKEYDQIKISVIQSLRRLRATDAIEDLKSLLGGDQNLLRLEAYAGFQELLSMKEDIRVKSYLKDDLPSVRLAAFGILRDRNLLPQVVEDLKPMLERDGEEALAAAFALAYQCGLGRAEAYQHLADRVVKGCSPQLFEELERIIAEIVDQCTDDDNERIKLWEARQEEGSAWVVDDSLFESLRKLRKENQRIFELFADDVIQDCLRAEGPHKDLLVGNLRFAILENFPEGNKDEIGRKVRGIEEALEAYILDPQLLAQSYVLLAKSLASVGYFREAERILQEGKVRGDPDVNRDVMERLGGDPNENHNEVTVRIYLAGSAFKNGGKETEANPIYQLSRLKEIYWRPVFEEFVLPMLARLGKFSDVLVLFDRFAADVDPQVVSPRTVEKMRKVFLEVVMENTGGRNGEDGGDN